MARSKKTPPPKEPWETCGAVRADTGETCGQSLAHVNSSDVQETLHRDLTTGTEWSDFKVDA